MKQEMPGLYDKLALGDQEMDQMPQTQQPGQTPQAGAPAAAEPVPQEAPAGAPPGTTAAPGTDEPVTEDAELVRMLRIAGLR